MVCLETSFIIDFFRGDKEAIKKMDKIGEEDNVTIASPSVMELISSVVLSEKPIEEKNKILEFLSDFLILPFGKVEGILAGEIEGKLTLSGNIIGSVDIMIGAIAKCNSEDLVTRNKKHFERIDGLNIISY